MKENLDFGKRVEDPSVTHDAVSETKEKEELSGQAQKRKVISDKLNDRGKLISYYNSRRDVVKSFAKSTVEKKKAKEEEQPIRERIDNISSDTELVDELHHQANFEDGDRKFSKEDLDREAAWFSHFKKVTELMSSYGKRIELYCDPTIQEKKKDMANKLEKLLQDIRRTLLELHSVCPDFKFDIPPSADLSIFEKILDSLRGYKKSLGWLSFKKKKAIDGAILTITSRSSSSLKELNSIQDSLREVEAERLKLSSDIGQMWAKDAYNFSRLVKSVDSHQYFRGRYSRPPFELDELEKLHATFDRLGK